MSTGSESPTRKRKSPQRKPRSLPSMPEGLDLTQRLNYISTPVDAHVLAELLGVSPITLYKRARKNLIPHIRLGGAIRFCTRSVARWLQGVNHVAA